MRVTQVILFLVCFNLSMAFIILIRLLLSDLEAQTFQATEEVMVDASKRYAQQVEAQITERPLDGELCQTLFPFKESQHEVEIKIYKFTKTEVGLDHYVTDEKGVVIFDTKGQFLGQDFSEYNDVARTLAGEYGARSTRAVEEDPQSSVFYVAAPIKKGDQIMGVLSLYKSQSDVREFITARRQKILQACILMGVGVILFVATVFFWVYRPIGMLTRYARGVIEGRRPKFPQLGKGREINTLGNALRTMRETLEGRDYAKNYVQTLSHELKSPISAIKATAELLQEEMPTEQRQKFLNSIISQVERSEKAISRLQQLSHVEKLTELERQEKVEMNELIEYLVRDYEQIAKSKGVSLHTEMKKTQLRGDRFLLRAIFQNLLDNAIKYSSEGGQVRVTLEEGGEQKIIQVRNTGEAIPDFAREKVFERLFSMGNDEKDKGSGVGLALVKEAVNLHHGKVSYDYVDGENIFQVMLPA